MITIAVVAGGAGRATSAHLPHVLLQKASIINGDARQGWSHLVEAGLRGKALLHFKSQHPH